MPWVRFYAEGEPVEEVHKLIEANMRIPRMTFGDLGAQVAACSVAERALQALATRYGAERAGAARGGADRLHRAPRPAGDPHVAGRDGDVHRLPRLGRDRGVRRADHGDGHDRGRRGDRRPDGVGADGARLAQQHPLLRARLRLPGGPLCAHARGAEHGRRLPARARADEAGHRGRGRDAGRLVDARRHRLPGARCAQRRARAADPRPGAGRGRGRQHARDLRRRPARRRRPLRLLRAHRRHVGRDADLGRQRRPHEPRQPGREHPGRGGGVGVPDRDRALRARPGHGRRGRASRRARDRARVALPHARHLADRALGPRRPAAVRARGRRAGRDVEQRPAASRRDGGDTAGDVLDHDRRGRRLRPPHGGRRRVGRPVRARSRARSRPTSRTGR